MGYRLHHTLDAMDPPIGIQAYLKIKEYTACAAKYMYVA